MCLVMFAVLWCFFGRGIRCAINACLACSDCSAIVWVFCLCFVGGLSVELAGCVFVSV